MKTSGCAYCCGDLITVEGLLGAELFCPACRRFQPREPRYVLPAIIKREKPVSGAEQPAAPAEIENRRA